MANRLEKRGYPNFGLYPLRTRTRKSVSFLGLLKVWLGLCDIDFSQWPTKFLDEWWLVMTGSSLNRKSIASLTLLTY
jgi:hypothetical protein